MICTDAALEHLAHLRGFRYFFNILSTFAGTICDRRNLLEHWKWWTGPSSSSEFGGEVENNLDRSVVRSKDNLRVGEIMGEDPRWRSQEIYWRAARETCCCRCWWMRQTIMSKVAKTSRACLIFVAVRANICRFHQHYEMTSCFGG